LTALEKKFNKLKSETRFKAERTFGEIKRWFNGGLAKYEKMHNQNLMEAISYNLYRSPAIIANNFQN
jgi:IS5 family transposase